jgi:peptide/nickel transport system ATP-binding protein
VPVMYLGRLCGGVREQLFASRRILYRAADPRRFRCPSGRPPPSVPVGEPPSPIARRRLPFSHPLPRADQRCGVGPELRAVAPGQFVACHHPLIGLAGKPSARRYLLA